jgi:hypothetical protein
MMMMKPLQRWMTRSLGGHEGKRLTSKIRSLKGGCDDAVGW